MKKIIFSDLEGTLLDGSNYSYNQSLEMINSLHSRGVPIVFCSAKTKTEQEVYSEELNIADPFIVENGRQRICSGGCD